MGRFKEIEIPLLEFRLTSLKTGHMAYVYSGLVVGILGNLINEYDNLCRTYCDNVGMLVSNEKEPQTDLRVFSSEQDDQRLLPLSCSERETWSKYNKGNIVSQAGEVEKLNRKLQILEDDTETVKRAFFSSVEERRILIHEIHELFQIIHHFLCLQSKGRDEKTHAGALIIPPHKVYISPHSFSYFFLIVIYSSVEENTCYVWFLGKCKGKKMTIF